MDAPSDAYLTLGGFGFRASWGRAAFMSASACIMGASICINGMYPPATSSTPFTRKPNSVSFEHTSEHVMHVRTEAALNPKPRRLDRDSRRKRRDKKKEGSNLRPPSSRKFFKPRGVVTSHNEKSSNRPVIASRWDRTNATMLFQERLKRLL